MIGASRPFFTFGKTIILGASPPLYLHRIPKFNEASGSPVST